MLVLVDFDLSSADLAAFEVYEAKALQLLSDYGAQLLERVRTFDLQGEVHLLKFSDEEAFQAFLSDPTRAAMRDEWSACGACSTIRKVTRVA